LTAYSIPRPQTLSSDVAARKACKKVYDEGSLMNFLLQYRHKRMRNFLNRMKGVMTGSSKREHKIAR